MHTGQPFDEQYQDFPTSRQTFTRNPNIKEDNRLGELPGQVCTSATGVHLNDDCSMNNPSDIGDHTSAFAGMYESDANYKWRKVRGNLDLFVMERNERHLTSLQWKWQKMSKSRRRTPAYEGFYNETPSAPGGDDVYKQMPESARTRSRAESRHRMREELDAYFYDRWKTADSRQQDRCNVKDSRVQEEQNEANPYQNASRRDIKPRISEYAANNEGQPQSNPYCNGVADTSKWSRHGYNPEPHFAPPSGNYPLNFQNIPTRQPPYPGAQRRGLNSQEPFVDQGRRAEYLGTNLRQKLYNQQQQNFPTNNQGANANYNPYLQENQSPYDPYSRGKSHYPNPAYPPCDPGYPNYGYTPEYGTPTHYHPVYANQQHHPDYQYSPGLMNEGKVVTPYADTWMKKEIPPCAHHYGTKPQEPTPYSFQQSCRKTDKQLHDNSSSMDGVLDNKYHSKNVTENEYLFSTEQAQRTAGPQQYRAGTGSGLDGQQQGCDENSFDGGGRKAPMFRRQRKMFADVSTVNEEDDDDDVFLSPVMSPEQKNHGDPAKFFRDGISVPVSSSTEKNNLSVMPIKHKNVNISNEVVGDKNFKDRLPNEKRKFELSQTSHSVDKLQNQQALSSLLVNSRPRRKVSMSRFSVSPESEGIQSVPVPRNHKLPPLQAEHLGSVLKPSCTTTPYLTPGSSTLSDDRNKQGTKRNKGSGKRVVFARESSLEESLSLPKREKLEDEAGCVKSLSASGAKPLPHLKMTELETTVDTLSDKSRKSSNSSHQSNIIFLDVKPSISSNKPFTVETNDTLQEEDNLSQTNHETETAQNAQTPLTPKHEREMTTIHVGDIDVKSDISLQHSCNSSVTSMTPEMKGKYIQTPNHENADSDNGSHQNIDFLLSTATKSESDEPEVENKSIVPEAKSSDNAKYSQVPKAPVSKSKSSLWKLAKNIQRRVGTKLHLRRGGSQSSASEECFTQSKVSSVEIPTAYKHTSFLSDNDSAIHQNTIPVKDETLSHTNDGISPDIVALGNTESKCSEQPNSNVETASFKNENTVDSTKAFENKLEIELQTLSNNSRSKENTDSKTNITGLIDDVADSHNNEIVKEGKIKDSDSDVTADEETLNAMNHSTPMQSEKSDISIQDMPTKDQANVEKYAYEEEMRLEEQRKKNEEIKNKLLKEQHEMEYEIHNLKKLLMAKKLHQEDSNCVKPSFNDKLEALESQIADLDNKLTDTSNKLRLNEIETQNIISNTSHNRGEGLPPNVPGHPLFIISHPQSGAAAAVTHGAYTEGDQESCILDSNDEFVSQSRRRESIDKALAQQENFKAELELQMATMKAELEKQLKEQNVKGETVADDVIDARVTNLEKQIEEMNKKIQSAEAMICKTENFRKKELEGKISHPEKSPGHSKKHHGVHQHPKEDVKRLIRQLSLSPKVSPAPDRKSDDLEKKIKLQKTPSVETAASDQQPPNPNEAGDDAKHVRDDNSESDDDVIILDDESLENTIVMNTCEQHTINEISQTEIQRVKSTDGLSCVLDHNESSKKKDINTKLISTSPDKNEMSLLSENTEAEIESKGSHFVVELTVHQCDSNDEQITISKSNENQDSVQDEDLKPDCFRNEKEINKNNTTKEYEEKIQSVEELTLKVPTASSVNITSTKNEEPNVEKQTQIQTKKDDCNLNERSVLLSQGKQTGKQEIQDKKLIPSKNIQLKGINCSNVQQKNEVSLQTSSFIGIDGATRDKEDHGIVVQVKTKQTRPSTENVSGAKQQSNRQENISTENTTTIQAPAVLAKPVSSSYTPSIKRSESGSKFSASKKTLQSIDSAARQSNENTMIDEKVPVPSLTRKYHSSEKDSGKAYGSFFVKPSSKQCLQANPPVSRTSSRKPFTTNSSLSVTASSRGFRRGSIVDSGHGCLVEKYRLKSQPEATEEDLDKPHKTKLEKLNKTETDKDAAALIEDVKVPDNDANEVDKNSDTKEKKSFFGGRISKLFVREKKKIDDSALKSLLKGQENSTLKTSSETKAKPDQKPEKQTKFVVKEFTKKLPEKEKTQMDSKQANHIELLKGSEKKPVKRKPFYSSWFGKSSKKVEVSNRVQLERNCVEDFYNTQRNKNNGGGAEKHADENASETTSSDGQHDGPKSPRSSEQKLKFSSGRKSTLSADITSDISSLDGSKESHSKIKSRSGHLTDREVTITSVGSGFTEMQSEDRSQVQIPSSSSAAERGWEKSESRQSLLYGLGTNWCVCPKQVWKYLGDENDEEPITRRKCISIIMGSVLAFLLLAVVLGLIIGLAASGQAPTESPIRFVVIQGDDGGGGA